MNNKQTNKQKSERKEVEKTYMIKIKANIQYSLDFVCLNNCKLYNSYDECKKICMVPTVLIDNSDRGW